IDNRCASRFYWHSPKPWYLTLFQYCQIHCHFVASSRSCPSLILEKQYQHVDILKLEGQDMIGYFLDMASA
ncbi:TPA: hypothetical protein ACKRTE_004141, partial [Providencia rettgeri]